MIVKSSAIVANAYAQLLVSDLIQIGQQLHDIHILYTRTFCQFVQLGCICCMVFVMMNLYGQRIDIRFQCIVSIR